MRCNSSGGIGIARLVLNGAMKHTPPDGSSMNLERSPFFLPWVPKKVRKGRPVSFETLISSGQLVLAFSFPIYFVDKRLYTYC